MHNAKVPHDDRCRDRIGELMAGDDDQRQVERMMSRTTSEVETPVLEKKWMLVNSRSSHSQYHSQFHSKFPQSEWVNHRAQEHEPDQVQEQMK